MELAPPEKELKEDDEERFVEKEELEERTVEEEEGVVVTVVRPLVDAGADETVDEFAAGRVVGATLTV